MGSNPCCALVRVCGVSSSWLHWPRLYESGQGVWGGHLQECACRLQLVMTLPHS